jgi:hypothetical protein
MYKKLFCFDIIMGLVMLRGTKPFNYIPMFLLQKMRAIICIWEIFFYLNVPILYLIN